MLTSAEAVYLDSSALVKLVVQEPESTHLKRYLAARPWQVSCTLARVEVVRAVRPNGPAAVTLARDMLGEMDLLPMDDALLDDAAQLDPLILRSLDAIHLAAAKSLGASLGSVLTYDRRMARAAREMGLPVESPGQPA